MKTSLSKDEVAYLPQCATGTVKCRTDYSVVGWGGIENNKKRKMGQKNSHDHRNFAFRANNQNS